MDVLLWIVAMVMVAVGVAGTVLPALPGTVFVFGGIALAAWVDDFTRISGWTVGVAALLAAIALATDYVAAALGAKRAGASRLAIAGAAIGTIVGVFEAGSSPRSEHFDYMRMQTLPPQAPQPSESAH